MHATTTLINTQTDVYIQTRSTMGKSFFYCSSPSLLMLLSQRPLPHTIATNLFQFSEKYDMAMVVDLKGELQPEYAILYMARILV